MTKWVARRRADHSPASATSSVSWVSDAHGSPIIEGTVTAAAVVTRYAVASAILVRRGGSGRPASERSFALDSACSR